MRTTIPGPPVGKGRPRYTRQGRAVTPPKTRAWELAASLVMRAAHRAAPLVGPVAVTVTAYHRPPQRLTPERRAQLPWCCGGGQLPDLDNVIKAALDALQLAGVIHDDAQVVQIQATSRYADAQGEERVEVSVQPCLLRTPPALADADAK